jgi:hypothetical protein
MARFFVNRGGGRVPEGPFEEQQLIRLILAGKVRSGHVCEEGVQRFFPIETHAPFAQALAQAGVALPATPAPVPRMPKPAQASSSRGTLMGAILAFFGLAIGAVAIGTYTMFSTGGTPAHAALPDDTELLFEIPSLQRLLGDLGTVRALDSEKFVAKQLLDDLATDLSSTFGVSKTQASALIRAASSLGVGARKLASAPEGGVVLTFSTGTPVNTFLQSKRFKYIGLVSRNGRKYQLAAAPPESAVNTDAMHRTLSRLKLDPNQTALVWFETSKVLYVGSPSFAEGVARSLSLDAPSLDGNPKFQAAKHDFTDKADAIVYSDVGLLPVAFDPRLKSVFDGYFEKAEPATASLALVPAGLVAHVVARFAATAPVGAPPPVLLPAAQPLAVIDRLPSETFAYVAAVTKTQLSGAELRQLLLAQLAKSDPNSAGRVTAELTQLEQQLHTHLDDVLGSLGDQTALALLAPADYSLTLAQPAQIAANFAVLYVQALKDEAPARALLGELEQRFGASFGQAQIHEDPSGYDVTLNDNPLGVSLQLRFIKGYLCLAVGQTPLVVRSLRALSSGESTLGADPAHKAARAALPSTAQVFAWVDAGRVLSAVLHNPLLSARVHDVGLDYAGIHWTGPERVTTALALSAELQKGVYSFRADTLNLPAFAGAFAASGL